MIDAEEIQALQDEWTARWHVPASPSSTLSAWATLIMQNHRSNFDLWHEEDKARDPDATDAEIARVKRSIDKLNQQRNDMVERLDEMSLQACPNPRAHAPLHSETPGMMIDRMSILALKIFHTVEQTQRSDAKEAHRLKNTARLLVLQEQRGDLVACLASFWREAMSGDCRFKIYRQMKMYNDPELNPAIYKSLGRGKRD